MTHFGFSPYCTESVQMTPSIAPSSDFFASRTSHGNSHFTFRCLFGMLLTASSLESTSRRTCAPCFATALSSTMVRAAVTFLR